MARYFAVLAGSCNKKDGCMCMHLVESSDAEASVIN